METVPFNPASDLAPLPFDSRLVDLGARLKQAGLGWRPHVGCFVYDPGGKIQVPSPFPGRVYFILSLPRFLAIFGSVEAMVEHLVWLPTWHQARLLCRAHGIADAALEGRLYGDAPRGPGEDLIELYRVLVEGLESGSGP